MLVLTRMEDEAIVIGGNIRILVVKIKDGRVRIGIDAPANIEVDREEVWQAKQGDSGQCNS